MFDLKNLQNVLDSNEYEEVLVEVEVETKFVKKTHNNFFINKSTFKEKKLMKEENLLKYLHQEITKIIKPNKYKINSILIESEENRLPF